MTGPILVTGGTGQLATALTTLGRDRVECVGRPEFDFDRPETIGATFAAIAPSLVVNAAAYTAVDAAETDSMAAYRANCDGPEALARLCAAAGVPLIHVSTDYVYDAALRWDTTFPAGCAYQAGPERVSTDRSGGVHAGPGVPEAIIARAVIGRT